MGCATFEKLSKEQLAKRIRDAAKDTANVVMTTHAKQQMKARKVTASMVYECLRLGLMLRIPEEKT